MPFRYDMVRNICLIIRRKSSVPLYETTVLKKPLLSSNSLVTFPIALQTITTEPEQGRHSLLSSWYQLPWFFGPRVSCHAVLSLAENNFSLNLVFM